MEMSIVANKILENPLHILRGAATDSCSYKCNLDQFQGQNSEKEQKKEVCGYFEHEGHCWFKK